MVRNIVASLEFYERAGFTLKNKWLDHDKIRWCWLEIGTAALMLQEYAPDQQHNFSPAHAGQGVSIYFICGDALAIYKAAQTAGLFPQEPFVGNGMWVVGLTDPDGYKIFFESLTPVPEETRYREWT